MPKACPYISHHLMKQILVLQRNRHDRAPECRRHDDRYKPHTMPQGGECGEGQRPIFEPRRGDVIAVVEWIHRHSRRGDIAAPQLGFTFRRIPHTRPSRASCEAITIHRRAAALRKNIPRPRQHSHPGVPPPVFQPDRTGIAPF